MSAEYRFLRFEVVGIATMVFLVITILPILNKSFLTAITNADVSLAIVASLFLFSLPIGYAEHQIVVNVYRSSKSDRPIFRILSSIVIEAEKSCKGEKKASFFESLDDLHKNSFLTSLLDLCVYAKQSAIDPSVYGRLSDRWSHFYARRATGRYAPIFSLSLWIVALILGYFFSWPFNYQLSNFLVSIVLWAFVFLACVLLLDKYANKIMVEISFLETSIVLADKDKIDKTIAKIVCGMVGHPEYIQKGESYGTALFKM